MASNGSGKVKVFFVESHSTARHQPSKKNVVFPSLIAFRDHPQRARNFAESLILYAQVCRFGRNATLRHSAFYFDS